ncbi:MAG: Hsp20/alpha crystallin family protein, partial [Candidatus Saganbacteria bacterium]|nr:Hsp20/alpha crystallin family protein [Candidatus Saganbacteria bacterium]
MAEQGKDFDFDIGGILEGLGMGKVLGVVGKGKEGKGAKSEGKIKLGGLLSGLGGLIDTLSELSEKGEALSRTGEIDIEGLKGKKGKAMYGFTIRTLAPEEPGYKTKPFTVSHFGNVKKDKQGKAVVEEVREPMVDIFDEKDHVLVVAEIPGVDEENVKVEIK